MNKFICNRTLRFAITGMVAILGLSSCNTVGDLLGINPSPGAMDLTITGPKMGTQVSVTVGGGDAGPQVFTDDGHSFNTTISLRPGTYQVTASTLSGYVALISVQQSSGNTTQQRTYPVVVESLGKTKVGVTYQTQP